MASLFDRPAGSRATLDRPDTNVRRILEKWQSGQRLSDSERRRLGQRMSSERTAIGTGSLQRESSSFDFSGETPQPNASFDEQPTAQPEQSYVTGGQSPFVVPASGGFNRQIYDESQSFVTPPPPPDSPSEPPDTDGDTTDGDDGSVSYAATGSGVFGELGTTARSFDTELTNSIAAMQAGIFDQPNNLTGGSYGRV